MVIILGETKDDLLAVRVSKKFTSNDFDLYRSSVKERMEKYGSARLYFEMVDFHGWGVGSFIENAVFDVVHRKQFGKVAMVGDKVWQKWAARLASPVKKEGIKYFDIKEKEVAMKWVNRTRI